MIVTYSTNVLLPSWLLKKRTTLSEQKYLVLVLDYLKRYQDYSLLRVDNYFAVCTRNETQPKEGIGQHELH